MTNYLFSSGLADPFPELENTDRCFWGVDFAPFGKDRIVGLDIYTNPMLEPVPKLKIAQHVPVSDAFRAEMDAWLLERFGLMKQQVIQVPQGFIISPSMKAALLSNL